MERELGFVGWWTGRVLAEDGEKTWEVGQAREEGAGDAGGEEVVVVDEGYEDEEGREVQEEGEEHFVLGLVKR